MENILTKALKEVLTPRYSEELRDAYDTGYVPTEGFRTKINELIRKTDRPKIHSYTRYIAAAAACAVIAVGAALIIPGIMNNRVEVEPEQTSSITSETPDITHGSVSISDTETSETDAPAQTDISVTSETISAATTSEISDVGTSVPTETSPGVPNVEIGSKSESDTTVPTSEEDDDSDDDIDRPDSDEDDVVSNDADDDDSDDDCCVGDDDDDAAPATVKNIPVSAGDTLGDLFGKNFGLSFDDLYAYHGSYSVNAGEPSAKSESFSMYYAKYDFIQDFVHKLGNAAVSDTASTDMGNEVISLYISCGKPEIIQNKPINLSAWRNYDRYFNNTVNSDEDDVDEDDVEPDDDDNGPQLSLYIKVSRATGEVGITENIFFNGSFYTFGDWSVRFVMDKAEVEKLFDSMNKTLIPSGVKTVGDIADAVGIGKDNIASLYASVSQLYDTQVEYQKISADYVVGLFTKYADKKLSVQTDGRSHHGATFDIVLKNDCEITVTIEGSGYMHITDGINRYYCSYDKGEIENAMRELSAANGYTIPIYSTLGEYLADKNFTDIASIYGSTKNNGTGTVYLLNDKNELKAFTELFKSEFNNARYLYEPDSNLTNGEMSMMITVEHYDADIIISGDQILVRGGANCFKASKGFGEKFIKLFTENEKTEKNSWNYNDEVVKDDEDDDNPVTD